MKHLWRLLRYVGYYKSLAALSVTMAVVVASLAFARIPALIPVFYALLNRDADREQIRQWPLRVAERLPWEWGLSVTEPLDRVISFMMARPFPAMAWMIMALIALTLLKGLAAFLQEYTAGKVHTGVARRVAGELYAHVLELSMSFHNRVGSASVTARFTNDVEALGRGVSMLFGKVLIEPLLLVGFVTAAALINWKLLLFNAALFPLLAIGVRALGRRAKRAARKGLSSRSRLQNILQESFEGISIVKAFNMESRERARFEEENQRVRTQDLKVVKVEAIAGPFIEAMGVTGVGLSILVAGWFVLRGEMTMVMFGTFYMALVSVSDPIRKLSNVNTRLQMLIAAATRVFEFLDEKSDIAERADARMMPPFSREIRVEDVYFTYNGIDTVLRGVDVVARRGEIIALVGPSGAGKTTIARLIPRFYDPSAGAVTIDGVDVREYTLSGLRDQIGLVTQEVILFNDTIAANISYGRPCATPAQIETAARAANAHEFILSLPMGYDSVIGEKGLTLSGGQRQRIALSRAIIKDPPILILDEATSSLDSESEHLIQTALDEFMKHRTSIVIAHRLSTIEKASRIYLIADGRVAASGTNEELLENSAAYKRLYSRQFRLAEA